MDKREATESSPRKRNARFSTKRSSPASRAVGGLPESTRVSPGLVYRWRAVAAAATTEALQEAVDSRGEASPDAHTARLEAELERIRRVVAEIAAE